MPSDEIRYLDAVVTVHVGIFGASSIDVTCRLFSAKGLTMDAFAALVYPALDAKAKMLDPAIRGTDGILRAG